MPSVTPFLWFDSDLREVVEYYSSVFPELEVSGVAPGDGPVFSASIRVFGQTLNMLNGGPVHAGFDESISMMITVDTQDEIDNLWNGLTADGGEPGQCGWLKDKYGLSWQVVPNTLGELLGGSDQAGAMRAHQAMMEMSKLDIAVLKSAYAG